ncbi:MAG TPA: hypothetical protein VGF35_00750, partial [Steroidobacteraceae bacterium]
GFATFSGVIGPIVTGITVDRTGNFHAAITIAATICVLNVFMWAVATGEFRTADWGTKSPPPVPALPS